MEDSETTELRFGKEALESQLKKKEVLCQALEDERASCLQALRATGSHQDVLKGVVSLCDRLQSLENERESLSNAGNLSTLQSEIDSLRGENSMLRSQFGECKKQLDSIRGTEKELYQREAELKEAVTQARGNVKNAEQEARRQVQFLEQENLVLMKDLKDMRRKYQTAKSELNVLRVQGNDDTTMEIEKVRSKFSSASSVGIPPRPSSSSKKTPKSTRKASSMRLPPVSSSGTPPISDNENATNVLGTAASDSVTTKSAANGSVRKHRSPAVRPGLGHEPPINEEGENTQECTQS